MGGVVKKEGGRGGRGEGVGWARIWEYGDKEREKKTKKKKKGKTSKFIL